MLPSLALLAILHLTNPQAIILVLGPGGLFSLPGAYGPLAQPSKSSPQSITNFEGGCFSYSVWQCRGGYQKTIQGPQPPGPAEAWLSIPIGTILREILRGNQSFQLFSRHQVFSIPWTTQLVHTRSNQASCMALVHLGQFIFHCGNSVT
ncbi:hypothetical protein O181_021939 [Austropuccinia psidii MF-1]|uniref:Secreted protein n=1 Tax=Austropuccinia psidii MF-1 TaxID=1389203 RepID=A0A9Q3CDW0_9BASI|nr:hypothetical protein [Austropuccinia psidii MF-1]